MDQATEELLVYLVSLIPSLTAVLTTVGTYIFNWLKTKKFFGDGIERTKEMAKSYKELSAKVRNLVKENEDLQETLREYKENFEIIKNMIGDIQNGIQEERVHEETKSQDNNA